MEAIHMCGGSHRVSLSRESSLFEKDGFLYSCEMSDNRTLRPPMSEHPAARPGPHRSERRRRAAIRSETPASDRRAGTSETVRLSCPAVPSGAHVSARVSPGLRTPRTPATNISGPNRGDLSGGVRASAARARHETDTNAVGDAACVSLDGHGACALPSHTPASRHMRTHLLAHSSCLRRVLRLPAESADPGTAHAHVHTMLTRVQCRLRCILLQTLLPPRHQSFHDVYASMSSTMPARSAIRAPPKRHRSAIEGHRGSIGALRGRHALGHPAQSPRTHSSTTQRQTECTNAATPRAARPLQHHIWTSSRCCSRCMHREPHAPRLVQTTACASRGL